MSGSTGWGARKRYRPDPGYEMASDDTLYDVVAWRQNMYSRMEVIRARIETEGDETQAKLDTIEASLTSMETDLESIDTNITTQGDETQAKLDTIEASLTAIESDVEANTSELQAINAELDIHTVQNTSSFSELQDINTELNSQTVLVTATNSALSDVNSELDLQTTALGSANSQLVAINTELDSQTALLGTIDSDTGSIDTKLATTNSSLSTINSTITTEGDQTQALLTSANSALSDINTELDTHTASLASASATLATLEGKSQKSHTTRISEGSAFMCHHNDSNLASGSTLNIYLKTPVTTPRVHMLVNALGSGAHDIEVLEAPTVTSNTGTNGTPVYNRDRDSGTTSGVFDNATSPAVNKIGLDVTVTADGTIIRSDVIGDGKTGGDYSSAREIILKANTAYVFRLTSRAAGNRVHINLDWYEA